MFFHDFHSVFLSQVPDYVIYSYMVAIHFQCIRLAVMKTYQQEEKRKNSTLLNGDEKRA